MQLRAGTGRTALEPEPAYVNGTAGTRVSGGAGGRLGLGTAPAAVPVAPAPTIPAAGAGAPAGLESGFGNLYGSAGALARGAPAWC